MRLFSKNKKKLVSAEIWGDIPTPKNNELFAAPVDNRLWHPNTAIRTSRSIIPQWYKNLPTGDVSLKRCYGLSDFIRTGYTIPMWATLSVRMPIAKHDERIEAKYDIIESTLFQAEQMSEKDMDYFFSKQTLENNQFPFFQAGMCPVSDAKARKSSYLKLLNPWVMRTAPGYSSLFLPALWEPNPNYQVLAGVVHTDYYPQANVVINITSNEQFKITEGTPLYHVIPFKREDALLKSSLIKGDQSAHKFLLNTGFGAVFTGSDSIDGGYKSEQSSIDKGLHPLVGIEKERK